jgi:hypothetical protein
MARKFIVTESGLRHEIKDFVPLPVISYESIAWQSWLGKPWILRILERIALRSFNKWHAKQPAFTFPSRKY